MPKSKVEVGKCGKLCSECKFFGTECDGCVEENRKAKMTCPIYECAIEKEVKHCLQCPTTFSKCELLKCINKTFSISILKEAQA
jgi:hypothetical protein